MINIFNCILLSAFALQTTAFQVLNVRDFGAIGNGLNNDTLSIQRTLDQAVLLKQCLVLFPQGEYLSWPLKVKRGKDIQIGLELGAVLRAPPMNQWSQPLPYAYLTFSDCTNVVLLGQGQIDGQGQEWWKAFRDQKISTRPVLISLDGCQQFILQQLILSDSPRFFVVIKNSFEVTVSDLVVEAPSDSPNTDGIDPSKSRKVRISGCIIENGDDGIAIKGGCQDIEVRNNVFRFGHGASVGSLGNNGSDESVSNVLFVNNTFEQTTAAVRIKTFEGGRGSIFNITYDGVYCRQVKLPIEVTQWYCAHQPQKCVPQTQNLNISNISIRHVYGTHTSGVAGRINCSISVPCTNFILQDIDLQPKALELPGNLDKINTATGKYKPLNSFYCERVSGFIANVVPAGCVM